MKKLTFFLSLALLFTSCILKRKQPNDAINQMSKILIYEAPVNFPDSSDLDFRILETHLFEDSIQFKVKYGGGCVKPHVFELYTSGIKNQEGVMDLYLVHRTHDDHCKALVLTQKTFIWTDVCSKGDKIRINGKDIIEVPDKKSKTP